MTKQEEFNQKLLEDISLLKERIEVQRGATEPLADLITKVAVLEHQVNELRSNKDVWQQRGWAVIIVLMSALFSFLSVIIGTLLTAYLRNGS